MPYNFSVISPEDHEKDLHDVLMFRASPVPFAVSNPMISNCEFYTYDELMNLISNLVNILSHNPSQEQSQHALEALHTFSYAARVIVGTRFLVFISNSQ